MLRCLSSLLSFSYLFMFVMRSDAASVNSWPKYKPEEAICPKPGDKQLLQNTVSGRKR